MFHSLNKLQGSPIVATDGEIGTLRGFLFDNEKWDIRFLVMNTGNWIPGRQVLISVEHMLPPESDSGKVFVKLTREQIKNSRNLSEVVASSTDAATNVAEYYRMSNRGEFSGLGQEPGVVGQFEGRRLRGTDEVIGCHLRATDGDIGHVEDFIFDDESLIIRYLTINTRNWLPGKKVLISPEWIETINWYDRKVFVDLNREAIKTAPEHDPNRLPDRDYEEQVFEHYQRPRYWIPLHELRQPGVEEIAPRHPN